MAKEKVTVEMTEEQKEKVVDILAKEEPKVELIKVNLGFGHSRNGVKYGPGWANVPSNIAGSLMAADHNALMSELKRNQSAEHLIEIVGRGVTRVVK